MDITLHILAENKTHAATNESAKWQRGQIVDCSQSADLATLSGNDYLFNDVISGAFVFVHVKDVPVVDFDKFRARLQTENPLGGRRRYRVDVASIPVSARNKLLADKEITITWATAKNYIQNDEIVTTITDGEVS